MEQGHVRKMGIVRMRNYGRIIQDMVQLAVNEPDVEKQQAMVVYIAQCKQKKNATNAPILSRRMIFRAQRTSG